MDELKHQPYSQQFMPLPGTARWPRRGAQSLGEGPRTSAKIAHALWVLPTALGYITNVTSSTDRRYWVSGTDF